MIRDIVTNEAKLAKVSESIEDQDEIRDILADMTDTAYYWQKQPNGCLGLAANQIGHLKRIIVVWFDGGFMPMINPEIIPVPKSQVDHKREGCLSRPGVHTRKKRHKKIIVEYDLVNGERVQVKYTGMTARVIQHEQDHLNGIFI